MVYAELAVKRRRGVGATRAQAAYAGIWLATTQPELARRRFDRARRWREVGNLWFQLFAQPDPLAQAFDGEPTVALSASPR
jgi:hypothetical protein